MNLRRLIRSVRWKLTPFKKISYSQCGEDLVIASILKRMKITHPFYVDIGANDPIVFSNTYFFYSDGASGVLVEPNPKLARKLRSRRSRDTIVESGIGTKAGELPFHVMRNDALSTFSDAEARRLETEGYPLDRTILIPVVTMNELFERIPQPVDLLSLDIEGLDLAVLEATDFSHVRPKIICVETTHVGTSGAKHGISALLARNGYQLMGCTPVNGIFVDRNAYERARELTAS